jgi:hypothetical protein
LTGDWGLDLTELAATKQHLTTQTTLDNKGAESAGLRLTTGADLHLGPRKGVVVALEGTGFSPLEGSKLHALAFAAVFIGLEALVLGVAGCGVVENREDAGLGVNAACNGARVAPAAGDLDVVVVDPLSGVVGHGSELDAELLGAREPFSFDGLSVEVAGGALAGNSAGGGEDADAGLVLDLEIPFFDEPDFGHAFLAFELELVFGLERAEGLGVGGGTGFAVVLCELVVEGGARNAPHSIVLFLTRKWANNVADAGEDSVVDIDHLGIAGDVFALVLGALVLVPLAYGNRPCSALASPRSPPAIVTLLHLLVRCAPSLGLDALPLCPLAFLSGRVALVRAASGIGDEHFGLGRPFDALSRAAFAAIDRKSLHAGSGYANVAFPVLGAHGSFEVEVFLDVRSGTRVGMANGAGSLSVVDSVVREVGVKFCVAEVCYATEGESLGGGGTEERKEDDLGKHDVDSEGKCESADSESSD